MGDPDCSNADLDEGRSWFLYVGEIKAAGLNRFLVEPLSRRYGKPAVCIHIVPDILAYYPDEIFLVVGPGSELAGSDSTERSNSRIPARQFAGMVTADEKVRVLIDHILDIQGELFLNVFEASPELSFENDERIAIIGPDPRVAVTMNNKLHQYEMATRLNIPLPEGYICSDFEELLRCAQSIFSRGKRAFISEAYSAGGSNSLVVSKIDEIPPRFDGPSDGFLVTEYVDHRYDPTVLGIVAGENEVYIASVADQNIEETRFLGSTFPTVLSEKTVSQLKRITRAVGSHMGSQGYRGVFGCDFIVDDRENVYFIEVNARKQGTTMETTLAMILNLPEVPPFPELEMMAVVEGRLPDGLEEMDSRNSSICWGTYNYKAAEKKLVENYVPQAMNEETLFREAAAGKGGYIVLDHVGPRTHISAGGFIARIVAAGPTLADVKKELQAGAQQVHMSVNRIACSNPK